MDPVYARYRTDERFRAAVLASAHRQRAEVIACFAAAVAAWFLFLKRPHAPCTNLARQG